jgi:O-antigen ligase
MNRSPDFSLRAFGLMCAFFLAAAFAGLWWQTLMPLWMACATITGLWLSLYPSRLFALLVMAVPLSVEYTLPNGLSLDLPDEPLMLGLSFLSGLVALSAPDRLREALRHPLILLLVLQWLWCAATLLFSTHPLLSLKFCLAKLWYILPFVLLSQAVLDGKAAVKRLALCFLLPVTGLALLILFRQALGGFRFSAVNEAVFPFFRNHVSYAATLSFALFIVWPIYRTLQDAKHKRIALALLILLLAAIFFSYTRGTWLSVLLAAGGLVLFRRGWLPRALLLSFTALALGFMVFSTNSNYLILKPDFEKTVVHTALLNHLNAMYKLREVSGGERLYRWIAGVRMIAERPVQGFGPATFYSNYKPYTDSRFRTWVSGNPERSSVHNYYLLTWIEQGLPGFVLFLLILAMFFRRCTRLWRELSDPFWKTTLEILTGIMLNVLVVNFFSDLIETDKVGAVFFLCLGVLVWMDGAYRRGSIA